MIGKRVLVIGGSRFVGPVLINLLIQDGMAVTVFNRGNIQTEYQNVTYIRGDRHTDFSLLNSQKFDLVFDMCAYKGTDTEQLLKQVNFTFLVHFGTVASYSLPVTFPIRETHPQGEWFWGSYGSGKAECEKVLANSNKNYAILRPTYILGEKNYVDRENFIYSKIAKGETLMIPGNGRALTQFVFVDEVASSLLALGKNQIEGAFNCVGDDYISLVELVEQMSLFVGKKPVIVFDNEHDRGSQDDKLFPFANENFLFDNIKIKKAGVTFSPLLTRLRKDWDVYYSKQLI